MSSLGILDEDASGYFRSEDVITREEMGKMVAITAGMPTRDASLLPSPFIDTMGRWSDAYITYLADSGIVCGKGAGRFDPTGVVSFGESAAMAMRTLGYNNVSVNGNGSTAYSGEKYLRAAEKLGVMDGVSIVSAAEPVLRGDAFQMVSNTLLLETVTVDDSGTAHGTGKTLAESTLNIDVLTFTVTLEKVREWAPAIDLSGHLYDTVELCVKKNLELTAPEKIVSCISMNYYLMGSLAAKQPSGSDKLTVAGINGASVIYDLPSSRTVPVYQSGAETRMTRDQLAALEGELLFFHDKYDQLTGVICTRYAPPVQANGAYKDGMETFCGYRLPTRDGTPDTAGIAVRGDESRLTCIRADDIVEWSVADGIRSHCWVTRQSFTGKVTAADAEAQTCQVGGKTYQLNGAEPAVGDEGTFYLDHLGRIAAFRSSSLCAILLGTESGSYTSSGIINAYPKLKLMGMDGTARELEVNVTGSMAGAAGLTIFFSGGSIEVSLQRSSSYLFEPAHILVQLTLDGNGRVSAVTPMTVTSATMKATDALFLADKDTAILDYSNGSYTSVSADRLTEDAFSLFYAEENGKWVAAVTGDALSRVSQVGIITGRELVQEDFFSNVPEYTLLRGDGAQKFRAAPGGYLGDSDVYRCKLTELKLDENGRVAGLSNYTGPVKRYAVLTSLTDSSLTLRGDDTRYSLSGALVVYQCDTQGGVTLGSRANAALAVMNGNVDVYLLPDGQVGYLVIAPKYYVPPYVSPVETTHYGLLVGVDSQKKELSFASAGEPTTLTYSMSDLPDVETPRYVKYTMQSGAVTSVTGLTRQSATIKIEGDIKFAVIGKTDSVVGKAYLLQSNIPVFSYIDSVLTNLSVENLTTDQAVSLYFDGETPVAVQVLTAAVVQTT